MKNEKYVEIKPIKELPTDVLKILFKNHKKSYFENYSNLNQKQRDAIYYKLWNTGGELMDRGEMTLDTLHSVLTDCNLKDSA